jgi:hypothetical protein
VASVHTVNVPQSFPDPALAVPDEPPDAPEADAPEADVPEVADVPLAADVPAEEPLDELPQAAANKAHASTPTVPTRQSGRLDRWAGPERALLPHSERCFIMLPFNIGIKINVTYRPAKPVGP